MSGWRKTGWPGLLDPANERLLRYAAVRLAAGVDVAGALYRFDVEPGFEDLFATRLALAVDFWHRLARRKAEEARRR